MVGGTSDAVKAAGSFFYRFYDSPISEMKDEWNEGEIL